MRGRKRILGLAALLSVLLAVPLVFSLGIIEFPNFSSESLLSTPSVFVDPAALAHINDPNAISNETLQPGSHFEVHVNITGVTDLFTWQINMSWDPSILNVSSITGGEFLATSPNQTSSEVLGWVMNSTDNAEGYSALTETILGDITGISGDGRLVTIEFLVVGYGSTDLKISISGTLATTLLDSEYPNPNLIPFTAVDGYFRNKYPGDVDGDYYCGSGDASVIDGKYGISYPSPSYYREADFDLDRYIGSYDASVVDGKYGKSFP